MKEFQTILEKYVGQYKDNQTKIKRRDIICAFKEEAEGIRERAEDYFEKTEEVKRQENLVAHFIAELNRLHGVTEEEYNDILARIEELRERIARIEYEKLSSEIHRLNEEQYYHTSNRDMIEIEKEDLEGEAGKIERMLHLLRCSRQQKAVEQEREELELIRQKLLVSRQKEEDLEPERNALGSALRRYYGELVEENEKKRQENEEEVRATAEELGETECRLTTLGEELIQNAAREGGLKNAAASYDRTEDNFNRCYEEALVRNILGVYEPGMLEIRREAYEKELEKLSRARQGLKRQQEQAQERSRSRERALQDLQAGQLRGKLMLTQKEDIRKEYEQELNDRRTVLSYLNLEEAVLFDTEKILHASGRKLLEIAGIRRKLEKEEEIGRAHV